MKKIGVYVHIPFCPYKCNYCDFLTYSHVDFMIDDYIDSLIKEIVLYEDRSLLVDTVFIGGGTPSYIKADHIRSIMDALRESFTFDDDMEISIEMNPDTLTRDKVLSYLQAGINRFSLGVQTFDDGILKILGRQHSREIVFNDIAILREAGAHNISVDMMMANPNQDMEVLLSDIEDFLSLGVEHISYYSLILEEKTMFDYWLSQGQISLFDDELEREMYHQAVDILESQGYKRYEISNFAQPGFESRHNKKYWNLDEYLGFGLGAASHFQGDRYSNARTFTDYHQAVSQGDKPVAIRENLTEEDREKEYIIMNMRLMAGIDLELINNKFDIDFEMKYKEVLDKHFRLSTIDRKDGRIFFTDYGIDVSNLFFVDII